MPNIIDQIPAELVRFIYSEWEGMGVTLLETRCGAVYDLWALLNEWGYTVVDVLESAYREGACVMAFVPT